MNRRRVQVLLAMLGVALYYLSLRGAILTREQRTGRPTLDRRSRERRYDRRARTLRVLDPRHAPRNEGATP
jgi:hypothetical protein